MDDSAPLPSTDPGRIADMTDGSSNDSDNISTHTLIDESMSKPFVLPSDNLPEVVPSKPQDKRLVNGLPPGWVKLNVGGKIFQTHRQTFNREDGSFLARLCQEPSMLPSDKDSEGAFLIDRDPEYFTSVLNYLRHGKVILDHGLSEEGLLEEAEFYNMPNLITLCTERIANRNKTKKNIQHVYRVLQCHGDELTSLVSHLSDGWKFKQLVPIGIENMQQNGDFTQEFVCVVSREYVESENAHHNYEGSDRAQVLQQKAMRMFSI
uniref:BTB domain-containing protein n=1 Tax=Panagrellus redivivus TaxID=6233 RepID=A0A7E4ZVK0_PANRE